jgi:hypothetical protein
MNNNKNIQYLEISLFLFFLAIFKQGVGRCCLENMILATCVTWLAAWWLVVVGSRPLLLSGRTRAAPTTIIAINMHINKEYSY